MCVCVVVVCVVVVLTFGECLGVWLSGHSACGWEGSDTELTPKKTSGRHQK